MTAATKKSAEMLAATLLLTAVDSSSTFVQLQQEQQQREQQLVPKAGKYDGSLLNDVVKLLQASDSSRNCRLPFRYLKHLARQMLKHNKIDDSEWIESELVKYHEEWEQEKTETAQVGGYYPFIQLNQDIYQAIIDNYGQWVIELMQNHLDDPTRIFPGWAAQFAAAAVKIGKRNNAKKHHDDLYRFVTSHECWQECAAAREKISGSIGTSPGRQKL